MADMITLYDIPTKGARVCWSPNCWKARMALNFKDIAYKTIWIEYPDIESNVKSFGTEPNEIPPFYTLPAVLLPDGSFIHDSLNIAKYLDKAYPFPPLHADDPIIDRVYNTIKRTFPLFPGGKAPRLVALKDHETDLKNLLCEDSEKYHIEIRGEWYSCSVEEHEKRTVTTEVWENARMAIEDLRGLLQENDGSYLLGKEASFADMMLIGFFVWVRMANMEVFNKLVGYGGKELKEYYETCKPWIERNDH